MDGGVVPGARVAAVAADGIGQGLVDVELVGVAARPVLGEPERGPGPIAGGEPQAGLEEAVLLRPAPPRVDEVALPAGAGSYCRDRQDTVRDAALAAARDRLGEAGPVGARAPDGTEGGAVELVVERVR